MMPVVPFNLFGMPGLVVPIAVTPEGLPIGVQLVGRPWEEELLLEVGARLEAVRGPFPAPPGY
jgi:Asp-tRNA(Asn)/Glu-tRNA(Gln) amidotransferase A subunit family amidase